METYENTGLNVTSKAFAKVALEQKQSAGQMSGSLFSGEGASLSTSSFVDAGTDALAGEGAHLSTSSFEAGATGMDSGDATMLSTSSFVDAGTDALAGEGAHLSTSSFGPKKAG